jgi:methylglutaconyl-CoA hydratase
LSLQLLEELLEHVADSAAGDGRALVLDHRGPVFCAGVDMRESRRSTESGETHTSLLARLLTELWAYPKPVLCRVGGPVRGGGIGLVACCDVVVATGAASFAFSEVRVGVAPAMVAAVALRKVPLGLLLPSLLTGEPFDARAAERLGLVSSVSDDDGALGRVADAILLGAPGALRTTKSLARDLAGASVADVLRETQSLSAALFADAEAQEGMAAFAERRPPSWIVTT